MPHNNQSLSEVHESVDTTNGKKGWRRFLAYIGPAYMVSVGYMDPGNWATDLQGGAQFGYQLIWVLLMSNLMALLLQSLSARLGIVRRRDLAQANRETYPPIINFFLYLLAEIAIAATDLAEVLGMAIGIHLLTGLPIFQGVCITVLDTFLFLLLQRYGIRKMEAFIIALVATIGVSFVIELLIAKPNMGEVAKGLIPTPLNTQALYIAVGIIGATVMPHNLYLHSALVQTRKIGADESSIKRALKFNFIDSAIALNAAFFVNTAILVLAASVFYVSGNTQVAKIEDAHKLLAPMLGNKLAPILFAIALIAAGQSSTITGTLAGQVVMEGYLNIRLNPWVRRLLTRLIAIVPALVVIAVYGDDQLDTLLVFSQVILSLQLGFAVIPLIHFVSDKKTMGSFTIKGFQLVAAWVIAAILVTLNAKLLVDELLLVYHLENHLIEKILASLALLGFVMLFFSMTLYPFIQKNRNKQKLLIHKGIATLENLSIHPPAIIAIALDFSGNDEKLIAQAISQGQKTATFLLIHIVETVSAKYSGAAADDDESRKDKEQLASYCHQLSLLGYKATMALGYKDRVHEIVKLVKNNNANMLVMGSHKHSGWKDYLYGETVDKVRHQLSIPVLIIN